MTCMVSLLLYILLYLSACLPESATANDHPSSTLNDTDVLLEPNMNTVIPVWMVVVLCCIAFAGILLILFTIYIYISYDPKTLRPSNNKRCGHVDMKEKRHGKLKPAENTPADGATTTFHSEGTHAIVSSNRSLSSNSVGFKSTFDTHQITELDENRANASLDIR